MTSNAVARLVTKISNNFSVKSITYRTRYPKGPVTAGNLTGTSNATQHSSVRNIFVAHHRIHDHDVYEEKNRRDKKYTIGDCYLLE